MESLVSESPSATTRVPVDTNGKVLLVTDQGLVVTYVSQRYDELFSGELTYTKLAAIQGMLTFVLGSKPPPTPYDPKLLVRTMLRQMGGNHVTEAFIDLVISQMSFCEGRIRFNDLYPLSHVTVDEEDPEPHNPYHF